MCRLRPSEPIRLVLCAGTPHEWDDSRRPEWVVCAGSEPGTGAFAALGPEDHTGEELEEETNAALLIMCLGQVREW